MAKTKNDKKGISKITIYKIGDDFPTQKAPKDYKEPTNGSGELV